MLGNPHRRGTRHPHRDVIVNENIAVKAVYQFFVWLWLCALTQPSVINAQEVLTIRFNEALSEHDKRNLYYIQLLKLALHNSSDQFGPYQLDPKIIAHNQEQIFAMVAANQGLDVAWGMSNPVREQALRAIPFPALRGLLSFRVILVRQERLAEFEALSELEQLSHYTAVQGEGWPDVDILRANRLKVVTHNDYPTLFKMLKEGHADYFPRSVQEVWGELRGPYGEGLVVVNNLVLRYFGPSYFFVHKDNEPLAQRIETGLQAALKSGELSRLLFSNPDTSRALAFLSTAQLHNFHLQTPYLLPSATEQVYELLLPDPK